MPNYTFTHKDSVGKVSTLDYFCDFKDRPKKIKKGGKIYVYELNAHSAPKSEVVFNGYDFGNTKTHMGMEKDEARRFQKGIDDANRSKDEYQERNSGMEFDAKEISGATSEECQVAFENYVRKQQVQSKMASEKESLEKAGVLK